MRLLGVLLALAVAAAPAAAAGVRIHAGVIDVDSETGIITASGGVVVSDGTVTIRAPRAVVNRAAGIAVFSGGVVVAYADGELRAAEVRIRMRAFRTVDEATAAGATLRLRAGSLSARTMTVSPGARSLVASGGAAFRSTSGISLAADRLRYDGRADRVTAAGDAEIRATDAVVRGARLEAEPGRGTATLRGGVRGTFGRVSGSARSASIRTREAVAVLEGDVIVARAEGTLWARRVTVHYRQGRVVAEDVSRIVIPDPEQ